MKRVVLSSVLILAVSIIGLVSWRGLQLQSGQEREDAQGSEQAHAQDFTRGQSSSSPDDLVGDASSESASYSDVIRRRVAASSRMMMLPSPPAMRSPSGEIDPLQCERSSSTCEFHSPLSAMSWDEAQWMRNRGFLDAEQLAEAAGWTSAELDARAKSGEPAAVAEFARRLLENGEELQAKEVLMDGIRRGNVYAAHRLAAIDEGRSLPHYSRPGLEWLFVARRMGDTQVTMSYISGRYPGLSQSEIDSAMLFADRWSERLNLQNLQIQRRPER